MSRKPSTKNSLQQIPNIGPAVEKKLQRIGISKVDDLRGKNANTLFEQLCKQENKRFDPCLLDTFVAAVEFANTGHCEPWWHYTPLRKTPKG